jgi:hypothetical protein
MATVAQPAKVLESIDKKVEGLKKAVQALTEAAELIGNGTKQEPVRVEGEPEPKK